MVTRSIVTVGAVLILGSLFGCGAASPAQSRLPLTVQAGNCSAIQAAINRLPPGGGEIELGPRTYSCTASIVINRDNVTLRGRGASTVLRLADHVNRPVLILGGTAAVPRTTRRGIHIADLAIGGNRTHQEFECSHGPCSSTDFLRNNGLSLRKVRDVLVEHVTVRGAKSGGLVSELGSKGLTIRDVASSDNELDGLAAYQTEDSLFTGLSLSGNGAAGLSFDIGFDNNIVSDTVIAGSAKVGIFMRDSSDNLFSALHVRNSGEHGVFLAQVEADATKPAAGNTFSGLVVSRSKGAGLRVNDPACINNLVVGAQFIDNDGPGISEPIPGLVTKVAVIVR